MNSNHLRDRIAWGSNRVARRIGIQTNAFRPSGPSTPLSPRNRYLRLPAVFTHNPNSFNQAATHGNPICYGHFDHSYTRPGDYLVQEDQIIFIASQEQLSPVVCVRTNGILTVRRSAAPTGAGGSTYGGLNPTAMTTVIRDWPASILGTSTGGTSHTGLPQDTTVPQWNVLLPTLGTTRLIPGDLVHDGGFLRGSITTAECTFQGWRLTIRQAMA